MLLERLVKVVKHVATPDDVMLQVLVVLAQVGVAPPAQLVAGHLGSVAYDASVPVVLLDHVIARAQPDAGVLVLLAKVASHGLGPVDDDVLARDDDKLVGREARGNAMRECARDRIGNVLDQRVAGGKAVSLVVVLEVLDVEVQDRIAAVVAWSQLFTRELLVEIVSEGVMGEQSGQAVVITLSKHRIECVLCIRQGSYAPPFPISKPCQCGLRSKWAPQKAEGRSQLE